MDGETGSYHPACPTRSAQAERLDRALQPRRPARMAGQYIIESIEEAQDHTTQVLWTYNTDQSVMGIGCITPLQKLKMAV